MCLKANIRVLPNATAQQERDAMNCEINIDEKVKANAFIYYSFKAKDHTLSRHTNATSDRSTVRCTRREREREGEMQSISQREINKATRALRITPIHIYSAPIKIVRKAHSKSPI